MSAIADRPLEEIKEEVAAHAAHLSAGMCRYLELVAECDRRNGCAGWDSTDEWLAWRCGLSRRTAREHVRVACALEQVPLSYHWDDDGSLVIRGRLAPEDGALFLKALEIARGKLWNEQEEVKEVGSAEPSPLPRRPSNVDALVAVADTALAHGGAGRPGAEQYQVVIHVEQEALPEDGDGSCLLADGPAIAPETARRLACDASILPLLERAGEPLGLGRKTRKISLALRRALEARDGCCRFPGCTRRHAQAHHIRHWADGGPTELTNLVLLCRRHHPHRNHPEVFKRSTTPTASSPSATSSTSSARPTTTPTPPARTRS